MSSPISVLLFLYGDHTFVIEEISEIPLPLQMSALDPRSLNTIDNRRAAIENLKSSDLKKSAYKRLRTLEILTKFYKDWYLLKDNHYKPVSSWDHRDFSIHAMIFFLTNADSQQPIQDAKQLKKIQITWNFLDYLRQFFESKQYTGDSFINEYGSGGSNKNNKNNNSNKSKPGYGLQIVKAVCKQFNQKTGQFTKVKKSLSEWAKSVMNRYTTEQNFNPPSMDDMKTNVQSEAPASGAAAGHKIINPEPNHGNISNAQQNNVSSAPSNSKWFWFCDDQNAIKWIPYNEGQQKAIHSAWNNGSGSAMIGKYKVDFDRNSNSALPCGRQYNTQIQNAWRRDVIRAIPDENSWINGVPCHPHPYG